jgi:hypothetical protein
MGLTNWILKQVKGDPEEQAWRKEIKAKAKMREKEAFHDAYEEEALLAADERGRAKAKLTAQKKGSGGGLLNTLATLEKK